MKIRKITKKNKEEMFLLSKEEDKILQKFISFPVYDVEFSREHFDRMFKSHFRKNHYFLGIETNGGIIGIISGFVKPVASGEVGYIDNMFITKKYRGKGYAKVLRDEFFNVLKEKGIKHCQLDVFAKNVGAMKLYERWGFKVDGLQMTKKF